MSKYKNKLVILQTVTPDYRSDFFKEIEINLKDGFELYSGDDFFDKSIKSDVRIKRKQIKNYFLFDRKLLFQIGIWHLLLKDIVLVLEMNPRILSNWILLIIRKIFNKETILWGHAWSKSGEDSNSEKLRHFMKMLSSKVIVYTNKQKNELKKRMPGKEILAAPNSLISSSKMQTNIPKNYLNLIYVGRLTESKKPFFLVKAFESYIKQYPIKTNLIIVGSGQEREKINEYIIEKKLENRIKLKGHIGDYEKLKELYAESFFSVSPSLAGLSITQSFGFGVPMIISKNEKHGPEIEAVKINENALFFESDKVKGFNKIILEAFDNKEYWIRKRVSIVDFCKNEYSVEAMSNIFIDLCK